MLERWLPMSDVPPSIYRDRDLYFFVTSRFIATLAIQVQSVAIGWQVYDMERTPLALGLVGLYARFLLSKKHPGQGAHPSPPRVDE